MSETPRAASAASNSLAGRVAGVDFGRLDPRQLPLDGDGARLVDRLHGLFGTPGWRVRVAAEVPEFAARVSAHVAGRVEALKAARQRAVDLHKAQVQEIAAEAAAAEAELREAGAPPVPEPRAGRFVLGVKAVDRKTKLGLPSVVVRLLDAREPRVPLAEGLTDPDGNALLSLSNEEVKKLGGAAKPVIELVVDGETVFREEGLRQPQPDGVDRFVAPVKPVARTQPLVADAEQTLAERTSRLEGLKEEAAQVDAAHEEHLADLGRRQAEAEAALVSPPGGGGGGPLVPIRRPGSGGRRPPPPLPRAGPPPLPTGKAKPAAQRQSKPKPR